MFSVLLLALKYFLIGVGILIAIMTIAMLGAWFVESLNGENGDDASIFAWGVVMSAVLGFIAYMIH